jgi:hypothetical protein
MDAKAITRKATTEARALFRGSRYAFRVIRKNPLLLIMLVLVVFLAMVTILDTVLPPPAQRPQVIGRPLQRGATQPTVTQPSSMTFDDLPLWWRAHGLCMEKAPPVDKFSDYGENWKRCDRYARGVVEAANAERGGR